jgi:hypothetical protein
VSACFNVNFSNVVFNVSFFKCPFFRMCFSCQHVLKSICLMFLLMSAFLNLDILLFLMSALFNVNFSNVRLISAFINAISF